MNLFQQIILKNWSLKLTAIFLAFVLWLAVHGDPGTERTVTVPLEIRKPRDMEITSDRPSSVEVTIRGSISNLGFGQPALRCIVDLESTEEGIHTRPLGRDNVRVPRTSGLEVISVSPARVQIALERTTSKEVPIVARIEGTPASGFEIYSVNLSPAATVITGPRSHIGPIKQIRTEPISLRGSRESLRASVSLDIKDDLVHSSTHDPVEVSVEIGPRRKLHTISRVPILPDDSSVTVEPSQVSVQLLVPITFKGSLSRANLTATVSMRDLDPSLITGRVKPSVNLTGRMDSAISIKEIVPSVVTVRRAGKS